MRANVVDDWDAALAHLPGDAPVERGRVDDHSEGGPSLVGGADELFVEPKNFRETADDLSDADDGQVFGIDDDVATGGAHALSAGAEEVNLRSMRRDSRPRLSSGAQLRSPPQRLDQLRAIHFARGFTR